MGRRLFFRAGRDSVDDQPAEALQIRVQASQHLRGGAFAVLDQAEQNMSGADVVIS